MTKTVTFNGQKYIVRENYAGEYIEVSSDISEDSVYLSTLTKLGLEWEYDPEPPTDGHYLDNVGDLWFFENGEGVYWDKDELKWYTSPYSQNEYTFKKAEPEV